MSKAALGSFVVAVMATAACGGSESAPPPDPFAPVAHTVTAEVLASGQETYTLNCAPCHGPLGKGDGPASATLNPKPRDHSSGEYMDELTDQQIADTVKMGGAMSGYPNMPSHPHIGGDDMVALVAFVRTLSHDVQSVQQVVLKP